MNAPLSRSTAILCLLFVFAALGGCISQTASDSSSKQEARLFARIGDFAVFAAPAEVESLVVPSLRFKDADVAPALDPVRTLKAEQVQIGFPLPECRNMKVEMFTGGANCCFGYYLLTRCPDGEYAAYIEPREGGLGASDAAKRAYPATEAAFYYYEPAGQMDGDKLSFNRPDSPRPTRYLVFEKGSWRTDAIGEFPAAYTALIREASRDKTLNPSARAIVVSYYTLMAGKSPSAASGVLARSLPRQYAPLAPQIFADIQKAAAEFNPVKNLSVDR